MKKALIFGANGFLGHTLIKLAPPSYELSAVYHSNTQNINESKLKALYSISDFQNLKNEYDLVFALAAFIPYGKMNEANERFNEVNVLLINRIVQKFTKARIIFSSSVSVFGDKPSLPISMQSSCQPNNFYSQSKFSAEKIIKTHPNYAIIRFSSLYGKGMVQSTFIPQMINRAKSEMLLNVYGDGSRQQDYLHIEDAANLCFLTAEKQKNINILGVSGNSISNLEVAKTIQRLLPNCEIKFKGNDNSPSYIYKTEQEIENQANRINFEDGIKQMIVE